MQAGPQRFCHVFGQRVHRVFRKGFHFGMGIGDAPVVGGQIEEGDIIRRAAPEALDEAQEAAAHVIRHIILPRHPFADGDMMQGPIGRVSGDHSFAQRIDALPDLIALFERNDRLVGGVSAIIGHQDAALVSLGERQHFGHVATDELAAGIDPHAILETLRGHPAADRVAGFDEDDVEACCDKLACRRKAGEPCAHDDHVVLSVLQPVCASHGVCLSLRIGYVLSAGICLACQQKARREGGLLVIHFNCQAAS